MDRINIINHLVKKNNYTCYLEIGVRNPKDCFNLIECKQKHSVDPGFEFKGDYTFCMTSDEFFKQNKNNYDIVFIDGMHLAEQCERDIVNSFRCLNENGIVVVHDCNPPSIHHAREDYEDRSTPAGIHWNGTVWKSLVKIRSELSYIHTSVVDVDWGVGLLRQSEAPNPIHNWNTYFSFNLFNSNKKYFLNLINYEEFIKYYIDI